MGKGKTVHLKEGQPLQVQSIEDRPSRSVVGLAGRRIDFRVATTPYGGKDYIPENIILRVEDNS